MTTVDNLIAEEVARQDALWGDQVAVPDDRWMEIAEDEFKDLKWANRTRAELTNHTIEKEQVQLAAVLYRWIRAVYQDVETTAASDTTVYNLTFTSELPVVENGEHVCGECGRSFTTQQGLNLHKTRSH